MGGLNLLSILLAALAFVIGGIAGYLFSSVSARGRLARAEKEAEDMLETARRDAELRRKESELAAKEEIQKAHAEFDRKTSSRRTELQQLETQIKEQRSSLDQKVQIIKKQETDLAAKEISLTGREKQITVRETEVGTQLEQANRQLERTAGMSAEEARKILMDNFIGQAKIESAGIMKDIRDRAIADADKEAQNIIIGAIQRTATDHSVESTVTVVSIPSDEMKGRIIGREGRNIRSFEQVTGVEVIVDDSPDSVTLSAFDPVRREIARIALTKLVTDGRIHPSRIEELVVKAQKEVEVVIKEAGEQACFELGLHNIHPDLVRLLGKLRFRTSYGQNVLKHSIEVGLLAGLMAVELGLDGTMAKRAGLLHDLGKAIDRDTEGTHTQIGYEVCTKYNEPWQVLNAIQAHHDDVEITTPITILVQAADGISGSRPGARGESLENYIKRLEKLEQIADGFKGVSKSYAIQAGREIRVMVESSIIDDAGSFALARDIAAKIQAEMEYPGQIKVTAIRETRAVDYAK